VETRHDSAGTPWKRRGILTAAGAVMAGIVAKQMSEPVAASEAFLLPSTETAGLSYLVTGPTTITANATYASTSPILTLSATGGNTQVAIQGAFNAPAPPPSPAAVFGQGGNFVGLYGTSNFTAVRGDIPPVALANSTAVNGTNQATLSGSVGVLGNATNGIGGSFQGGTAPLRLVPGALASTALSATGHQAGEIYVTSDRLLYFFDGTQWRQVQLGASTTTTTPTPTPTVTPGPTPTGLPGITPTVPPTVPPGLTPTPVPGTPNPLPPGRSSAGTPQGKQAVSSNTPPPSPEPPTRP
jgi:hypothetical protein